MAFVDVAIAVGTAVGVEGIGAGSAALLGGGILGAGAGALYSGITGDGNILNSMLTGGLIGAGGAYGLNAAGIGSAATGAGTIGPAATVVNTSTPALTASQTGALTSANVADLNALAAANGVVPEMAASLPGAGLTAAPNVVTPAMIEAGKAAAGTSGMKMLGYGLAGTAGMQLLGGKKGGTAPASATDPGNIRPYEFSPNQNPEGGAYPSPYAKAQYDAAGMPILDTRERNYFDQQYTAMTPYSARSGTVNPNKPIGAATGGLMAIGGPVERMTQNVMGGQENMFPQSQQEHTYFATPTQMPASAEVIRSDYDAKTNPYTGVMMANGGIAKFADKGMVDEEAELRKVVMNNLKKLNPDQLQDVFATEDMREKQFLMKNMPNYAAAMRPSVSGMIEGAQYGDRMQQAYGGQPRDVNVMPRIQDVNNYGGIASIGQQVDPDTRVNMMADLQRTPYDRNALESVRRVGAGIDRKIGKDANLSAYYEQDPMGRNKSGGVRYTQNFAFGGLTPIADLVYQLTEQERQNSMPKYSYDQIAQKYNQTQGSNPQTFAGIPQFNYDSKDQKYTQMAKGGLSEFIEILNASKMAQGGAADLGDFSDGGRLLKGPGDGVSDDIPATIAGKQPARLADGEFVIPARIVSEIGNGSTDAGAKRLYAMMDRIQEGRKKTIGKKNVAKDTKAKKHLLA